jgi:hypothetical protein
MIKSAKKHIKSGNQEEESLKEFRKTFESGTQEIRKIRLIIWNSGTQEEKCCSIPDFLISRFI